MQENFSLGTIRSKNFNISRADVLLFKIRNGTGVFVLNGYIQRNPV